MFVCTSWCTFLCLQYKFLELELQDQKWILYEWVCVMTVHPERLDQGMLLPALWKRSACFAVASPTLYNSCFRVFFLFFFWPESKNGLSKMFATVFCKLFMALCIFCSYLLSTCLPGGKEYTCQCWRCKRHGFNPWVRKSPWSWQWQPTPVFLPGKFHGQKNLAGYSLWVPESQAWLSGRALVGISVRNIHFS